MSQSVKYLRYTLTLKAPAIVSTLSGDPNSSITQPFISGGRCAASSLANC